MIARVWHGRTDKSKYDAYSEFLRKTAIPDYKKMAGLQGLSFLRNIVGQEAHFALITYWQSLDAIRQFTGPDVERAKYYAEDKEYLLEFEEKVQLYEVFAP